MKYQDVWGLGNVNDLVLRVDATTAVRLYAQQDANGNVTALIDAAGAVQERYQYDPYGTVTVLTPSWGTRASSAFSWIYLFQGGRLDTSTGWYKFGFRDYVTSQGTWAEKDPITFDAGNNFYQFVGGSPAGLTDPSGLAPPSWGWPSWEDYSRYLRNPSEMDSGLQTAQNVSLGVGLAAATAATGGALAAVGSTTAGIGTFVAASGASIAALEAGKSLYNGGDSGDAALAGVRGAQEGVFLAQLPLMGSALLPKRLMPTRWPMSRGRNDCPKPNAPNNANLGDLTPQEAQKIQSVVDEAGRPLEVVGSAAKGTRRGVGTDLPIGKDIGTTRSDIDYLVPPGSAPYYGKLQGKLPSIDPNGGMVPGTHNPYMGPGIRFEPDAPPRFIPMKE